jgi:hypothetical protein
MLIYEDESLGIESDQERRRRLRTFLMSCRSRLGPSEVGLPPTARRNVQGLRRGEVAEMIGVTVEWYRHFESGRPVRVSPRFVARVARALRLDRTEEMALFRLAFLEMYRL